MKIVITILKNIKRKISLCRFFYYKTLIANFKLLPFKQAIHLPLVIYSPIQLKLNKAHIRLNVPARFGLIKWGLNQDLFLPTKTPSMLSIINGHIIINGPLIISPGVVFRICGVAEFGKHIGIGGGCKILINNKLVIGSKVRLAFGSIICDSDFHYLYNNGIIHRKDGKVVIGNSVWIGNNCSIVKNAVIPDNAVVSSKSFVNKNFGNYTSGILLAGTPAK